MRYAGGVSGGGLWFRACDTCQSAPSAVYCRADAALLCGACDASVHHANRVASRHERVCVCEACELAPAEITCRADAAALCAACDSEVHSANPLARSHLRVPILPLSSRPDLGGGSHPPPLGAHQAAAEEAEGAGEGEAVSWLAIDKSSNQADYLGGGVDDLLDLVDYNDNPNREPQKQKYGYTERSERVVPSCCLATREAQQQQSYGLEMEYDVTNSGGLSHPAASLSHSVSFASMDASVVPDASGGATDISNAYYRTAQGFSMELFCCPSLQLPSQFPMNREAKVLRYREKRKVRKFGKTIRYMSRKAYAEARPRIKGRFAKREASAAELEIDQMFYGVVPSFQVSLGSEKSCSTVSSRVDLARQLG